MRVLLTTGFTTIPSGWHRPMTSHLVRGIHALGGQAALAANAAIPEAGCDAFFPLDYPFADNTASQLADAIGAFKPDLIHVMAGGFRFIQAAQAAAGAVPWMLTVHTIPPLEKSVNVLNGQNKIYYLLRNTLNIPTHLGWSKLLLRGTHGRLICHSRFVENLLRSRGVTPGKIVSFPFGSDAVDEEAGVVAVDPGQSPFKPDAFPRIATVGGITHTKGMHDMIRVLPRLKVEHPKLAYCIMGQRRNASYEKFLARLIKSLGLEQTVTIIGNAPDAVRRAALAQADLYVQPSHEEGFCFAFLEGLIAVPRALGTQTGAMFDMAAGDELAQTVRTGDVDGLHHAARELLAKPVPAGFLSQRRQRLAKVYSWECYARTHAEVYRNALAGR